MLTFVKKLKSPPLPPAKLDPFDVLKALIDKSIAEAPQKHDGYVWCAMAQPVMAKAIGISVKTLTRMTSKPPFVRQRAHKGGKLVALIRIGEAGPPTKRQVQNHLANIWRKKTGRKIDPKGYGHLAGLVDYWGRERAPVLLRLVLDDWPLFMTGVGIEVGKLGKAGYKRYLKYPSSSVILRFHAVAHEMWIMDQQEKLAKKAPSASPIVLNAML
jgi:hypothetical protein